MNIGQPCITNPCLNGGTCVSVETTFICLCAFGFEGFICSNSFDNMQNNSSDGSLLLYNDQVLPPTKPVITLTVTVTQKPQTYSMLLQMGNTTETITSKSVL